MLHYLNLSLKIGESNNSMDLSGLHLPISLKRVVLNINIQMEAHNNLAIQTVEDLLLNVCSLSKQENQNYCASLSILYTISHAMLKSLTALYLLVAASVALPTRHSKRDDHNAGLTWISKDSSLPKIVSVYFD